MPHFKNISNQKFGKLTVISVGEKDKWGKYNWLCKCDCGKELFVEGSLLRLGNTKSCGCSRINNKNAIGNKNRAGKNHNGTMATTIYSQYKNSAKKRKLYFSLSFYDFLKFTSDVCFYCGCEPNSISTGRDNLSSFIYNGIDRIDNSLGYIKSNCVTCCKNCNYSKSNRTLEDFMSWIDRVHAHQHKQDFVSWG